MGDNRSEWEQSIRRKVLKALDDALFQFERVPTGGRDEDDAGRSATFHLGMAGGFAFLGRLPGIESDALFDDISDAAEEGDFGRVGRIRRRVQANLSSDRPCDKSDPGEGSLDLATGFLQMIPALGEARRAWREGDRSRHSLMLGFLVGLLHSHPMPYRLGTLSDAVIAIHARDATCARKWVEAESIEAREYRGRPANTDPRALLMRWLGDRLAAGHRFSEPLWCHSVDETEDERREREAGERAYFKRQETSSRRAQNFGKRLAARDTEGIWIPVSYSINRALVLGPHEEERRADGEHET
ncbi:hypothetical protein [Candidatus Palauibacter sp.]|uniref:hypothetical protein n=1 Tax=Candidatus Palauibacter sp. TaxID=3101350 RepID=UPI003B02E438